MSSLLTFSDCVGGGFWFEHGCPEIPKFPQKQFQNFKVSPLVFFSQKVKVYPKVSLKKHPTSEGYTSIGVSSIAVTALAHTYLV